MFVKNNVSSVEAPEKEVKEWEMRGRGAGRIKGERVVRKWRVYGREAMD